MRWKQLLLVSVVLALPVESTQAGIFSRKSKGNPAQETAQLVAILRSDPDERHRRDAADDLADYDSRVNAEIFPALIQSMAQDPSPDVRAQAAETLGKLRPISQQVGYALEQAQNSDPSNKVRSAARSALWQYSLVGYRPTTNRNPVTMAQTAEPPLANSGMPMVGATAPLPLVEPMPVPAPLATQSPPMPAAPPEKKPGFFRRIFSRSSSNPTPATTNGGPVLPSQETGEPPLAVPTIPPVRSSLKPAEGPMLNPPR